MMGTEHAQKSGIAVKTATVLAMAVLAACTVITILAPTPASAAYGKRTARVSGTALTPTNADSHWGVLSSGGRYAAFQSFATNLAAGGGAGSDVFLRDMRSSAVRCVSTAQGGATPNGSSVAPSISSNGQFVVFSSNASNLVAGDTNSSWDVFCRDMNGIGVTAVSVAPDGSLRHGDSSSPVISADGRRVAFVSASAGLVEGDGAGHNDIFVRDLAAGTTVRVTRGIGGVEANGDSSAPSINADGTKVAFVSMASNLVSGDTNAASDVFVVDVNTLSITRVSVRWGGTQANLGSYAPSISGNGQKVAFESLATNLASKDTNGVRDIFVRDIASQVTVRANVSIYGKQGNAESREPSLSSNGNKVVFSSSASNLVTKDTNGRADIFLRTFSTKKTTRLSTTPSGQAKASCGGPAISPDGYRVAYQTSSSNMVFSDSNKRSDVLVVSWGRRTYDRVQAVSIYETAVEASRRSAPFGAKAVVIVNSSDWRAAIAAAGLAGTVKGPILYTSSGSLYAETRDEIVRLGASKIYIVGGTTKVSDAVAVSLAGIVGAGNVERVGSGDGYSVANSVAARVVALKGSGFNGTVIVVSGKAYTTSMAAVPLAAGTGRPMVFVNPSTGSYRLPAGVKRAIIIGGTGSVPRSVETRLKKKLGTSRVVRITARDKYRTAVAVAKKSVSLKHTWDGVTVVNIAKPTEAVCGAVMAGQCGSVVLYTTSKTLPSATRARLTTSRYRIDTVRVMGSTATANNSVLTAIKKALGY